MLDKGFQRAVLNLKVRCSRSKKGCDWKGELRHLDKHERDECGWVMVDCNNRCGGLFPRRELEQHEREECSKRPLDVKLDDFMRKVDKRFASEKECRINDIASLEKMMEFHLREVAALERKTRESHLKEIASLRDSHEKEIALLREDFKTSLKDNDESHKKQIDVLARQIVELKKRVTPIPLKEFHENHGQGIELLNHNSIAQQRASRPDDCCIVFTAKPIPVESVFAVQIKETKSTLRSFVAIAIALTAFQIGITFQNPYFNKPFNNDFFQKHVYCFLRSSKLHLTGATHQLPLNIEMLNEGQTIGLKVAFNGDFHIFIDGMDQGVFAKGLPIDQPLWGVVDVNGRVKTIKYV